MRKLCFKRDLDHPKVNQKSSCSVLTTTAEFLELKVFPWGSKDRHARGKSNLFNCLCRKWIMKGKSSMTIHRNNSQYLKTPLSTSIFISTLWWTHGIWEWSEMRKSSWLCCLGSKHLEVGILWLFCLVWLGNCGQKYTKINWKGKHELTFITHTDSQTFFDASVLPVVFRNKHKLLFTAKKAFHLLFPIPFRSCFTAVSIHGLCSCLAE